MLAMYKCIKNDTCCVAKGNENRVIIIEISWGLTYQHYCKPMTLR